MRSPSTLLLALLVAPFGSASAQTSPAYQMGYHYDDARRLTGVDVEGILALSYAYDAAGNRTAATARDASSTSGESDPGLPTDVVLYPGYPNPFNPSTLLRFDLPSAGFIRIEIFDSTGRLVRRLVNERRDPGRYEVPFDARTLASGLYFARLTALGSTRVRGLLLVK